MVVAPERSMVVTTPPLSTSMHAEGQRAVEGGDVRQGGRRGDRRADVAAESVPASDAPRMPSDDAVCPPATSSTARGPVPVSCKAMPSASEGGGDGPAGGRVDGGHHVVEGRGPGQVDGPAVPVAVAHLDTAGRPSRRRG